MAIDWRHLDYLEALLKKTYAPLNNKECIERLTILLNLNSPLTLNSLDKKVREVNALNEYRAFKKVEKRFLEELNISIRRPADMRYKIKDCLAEFHRTRKDSSRCDKIKDHLSDLIKLSDYYNDLILNPYKMHRDIRPLFNSLADNHKMIVYTGNDLKRNYLYGRSKECDKTMYDLKNSLESYGILEFCHDKKEIFGRKKRKFPLRKF